MLKRHQLRTQIASLLGVDFVVSTVVWTDQSVQKRPQSVAVGWITSEGQTHNGVSEVRNGNIKEAARGVTRTIPAPRDLSP